MNKQRVTVTRTRLFNTDAIVEYPWALVTNLRFEGPDVFGSWESSVHYRPWGGERFPSPEEVIANIPEEERGPYEGLDLEVVYRPIQEHFAAISSGESRPPCELCQTQAELRRERARRAEAERNRGFGFNPAIWAAVIT